MAPLLVLGCAGVASAQEVPAAPAPGARGLETAPAPGPAVQAEVPPAPGAPAGALPIKISARVGKGFTFSAGDYFSMTLRGRFMLRYTYVHDDGRDEQELTARRARIYLQGHIYKKWIEYYFHVAFAGQDYDRDNPTLSQLYDVYLQLTRFRDLNVRIGQQLVPFNRERVISSQNAVLVDRSIVNAELNLDRDLGIKLFSNDLFGLKHRLGYEIFIGMGNGRNPPGFGNMGLLYAFRLQINPMGKFEDYTEGDVEHTAAPKLSIGLNYAYNMDAVRARSTVGPFYEVGDFDYQHAAADAIFKFRGFSIFSEFVLRHARRNVFQAFDPSGMLITERSRSGYGYFVQASYTGRYGLGGAARWSQLFAFDGTDPELLLLLDRMGKEIAGSLNWFIRGHVFKVQADYSYYFGSDLSDGRHQVRVQLHVGY